MSHPAAMMVVPRTAVKAKPWVVHLSSLAEDCGTGRHPWIDLSLSKLSSCRTGHMPMALAVSSPPERCAQSCADADFDLRDFDQELTEIPSIEIRDSKHLAAVMARIESVKRRAHALSIDLLEASEQAGLHYQDGHASAKVMIRHVNKLSGGEAAGREKCRRMFRKLPLIAGAY